MIKFFRQIRHSMISNNKISKYLFYALGEIFLVVIGILIALQVNEWNTQSKKEKTQINYLKEIKTNLQDDLTELKKVKDFNDKKVKSIDTVFSLFSEHPDPISYVPLFSSQMNVLTEFEIFSPNRIAFDNMVASESIDLITNQNLRNSLSIYYKKDLSSGTQERVKDLTRKFTDYVSGILLNRQSIKLIMNHDSQIRDMTEISMHNDDKFYSALFNMYMIIDGHNDLLNETETEINELIALLESNLNDLSD
ncbi:MAG: DUF6090 family protein [Flavobacteriaceae bacterium]|nr:DUF6090 family protein [Flavobacteriaceae bacterium]